METIADTLNLIYERLTAGSLTVEEVTAIEMPVVRQGFSWEVQDWEDAPIDGPMLTWAVTTFYGTAHRRPYDAESDLWLDEQAD